MSVAAFPHYYTDPDVTWANGIGCPLVVHVARGAGPGHPLFPLVHSLHHLLLFFTLYFFLFSFAVPVFFFCPSLPFLREYRSLTPFSFQSERT